MEKCTLSKDLKKAATQSHVIFEKSQALYVNVSKLRDKTARVDEDYPLTLTQNIDKIHQDLMTLIIDLDLIQESIEGAIDQQEER